MKLVIREGERSSKVADVQARLRALGHAIHDDAGHFGPSTKQAVRAFQQARGVLSDGTVGPHTWRELVEAGWRLGDRSLYLSNPLMRGDDVQALQARFNALGFDAGRADGIFGPDTDHAVRAFQREYGVPEDGIFGPRSYAALVGLRVDRPGTTAQLREELRRVEREGVRGAVIVLDPGHGGDDAGDRGPAGTLEADLCWDLVGRITRRLARAGARVRLTRTEAEGPDVSERARRANELGAELFASLHLNAHDEPTAEGSSVYYFHASRSGELLAENIQERLVALGLRDCRTHGCSYPILRETRMPAVILEPAFITNPDEEKLLLDEHFRNALADAAVAGIHGFYRREP